MKIQEVTVQGLGCHNGQTTMQVNGLGDINDWAEVARFVNSNNNDPAAIAKALRLTESGATEAMRLANQPTAASPESVLTEEGESQLTMVTKKAQAEARLSAARSSRFKDDLRRASAMARKAASAAERSKFQAILARIARELLAEEVKGQRALGAAAAAMSAVKFRRQAIKTKDAAKRRQLLGQAAAAVAKGNQIAKTKVSLTLPDEISDDAIRRYKEEAGLQAGSAMPDEFSYAPPAGNVRNAGLPKPGFPRLGMMGPARFLPAGFYPEDRQSPPARLIPEGMKTGLIQSTSNIPPLPSYTTVVEQAQNSAAARAGGGSAGGLFANLMATVGQPAQMPITSQTQHINGLHGSLNGFDFGSLFGGDTGKTIGDIAKVAGSLLPAIFGQSAPPGAQPQQTMQPPPQVQWGVQTPPPYYGPEGYVNQQIMGAARAMTPPGMEPPSTGLPVWVIPAGIGAAALVVGLMLI